MPITAAACWESAWCWRWASSMACWICTFGSAYSSTFEENSAIKYFHALVNGFAMTSVLSHPLAAPMAAAGLPSLQVLDAASTYGGEFRGNSGIPRIPTPTRPGLTRPALAPGRAAALVTVRPIHPLHGPRMASRASVAGDVADDQSSHRD